jgi:hypothetical protein
MALPRSARAGVIPLLWLGGALCLLLGVAAALLLRGPAPPPVPERSLQERVEAIDVVQAADLMADQLDRARAALTPALMPGEEETLAQLLRMQAEAADVELGPVRFETLGRDDLLESVGLELELTGAYYDLPIFVDGLFRQRHVVEVHRLTIESAGPGAVRVVGRVEARLFRPVAVSEAPIRESVDAVDLSASERGFAANALAAAAQLEAYEHFLELQPALLERKQANRRLVMRTIPRLVRKLPSSPMDWVGATFEGSEAKLAME